MTISLTDIDQILRSTGLPVAYLGWPDDDPDAPDAPYIAYAEVGSNNFAADGIVYFSARRIEAVLYTQLHNEAAHAAVETALETAGIFWGKSQSYIQDQKLYETIYTMEV